MPNQRESLQKIRPAVFAGIREVYMDMVTQENDTKKRHIRKKKHI